MTMWQPAAIAMPAAASLVCIPPDASAEPAAPAAASILGVIASTRGIHLAVLARDGSALYMPSMVDSSNRVSALIMAATRAARRSLSPKRISAVATVSFSLMIGTAPAANSVLMVLRALR